MLTLENSLNGVHFTTKQITEEDYSLHIKYGAKIRDISNLNPGSEAIRVTTKTN